MMVNGRNVSKMVRGYYIMQIKLSTKVSLPKTSLMGTEKKYLEMVLFTLANFRMDYSMAKVNSSGKMVVSMKGCGKTMK
jgi:hypothetical protein